MDDIKYLQDELKRIVKDAAEKMAAAANDSFLAQKKWDSMNVSFKFTNKGEVEDVGITATRILYILE